MEKRVCSPKVFEGACLQDWLRSSLGFCISRGTVMWWVSFCLHSAHQIVLTGRQLWNLLWLGKGCDSRVLLSSGNLGTGVKKWVGLWFPGKSWAPQGGGLMWLSTGRIEVLVSYKEMLQGTTLFLKSHRCGTWTSPICRYLKDRQHLQSCWINCRNGFCSSDCC